MHIRHLLRHRGGLAATTAAVVLPVSLAWAGLATAGTTPQTFKLPRTTPRRTTAACGQGSGRPT